MPSSSLSRPFDAITRAGSRLRDALADPARGDRTVLIVLALYVALWTIYGTVTKGAQGLNPDMTELVAWSRDLAFGYAKHPPLAAWLVRAWFTVMPVADWSYYLLAMLMPALTLWIVWHMSDRYLSPYKRVAALAVLMLIPFFNFHALKFNVNTVLMPIWAATAFWFLRSFTTHSRFFAALAGVGAAAAMLGKYWSIFLILGLVIAALSDRRRMAYLKAQAPWISVIAGALCLAPHIVWLYQNDFATFAYASAAHVQKPFIGTVIAALGYLGGSAGYVALPVILVLIAARPSRAVVSDMIWPADDRRRLIAAAFWAPLLLPVLGALIAGAEITSLWSMSAWALLPLVLLTPPGLVLRPADTARLVTIAAALPIVLTLVSPLIAIRSLPEVQPAAAQGTLAAREVERLWREATPAPLRYVGGDGDIVLPLATYAADRPRLLIPRLVVAADEADLRRSGMVLICFTADQACLARAAERQGSAPGRAVETSIGAKVWGKVLPPRQYTVIIVPPRP